MTVLRSRKFNVLFEFNFHIRVQCFRNRENEGEKINSNQKEKKRREKNEERKESSAIEYIINRKPNKTNLKCKQKTHYLINRRTVYKQTEI